VSHVRYGTAGWVGFGVLTLANIVSTTLLIWFAAQGRSVLVVFPFCLGNWGAYLLSHYLVEGHFIDQSASDHDKASEDTDGTNDSSRGIVETLTAVVRSPGEFVPSPGSILPDSRFHQSLGVLGVGGMFMTFPTGIVAVSNDNLLLLGVSASLFVVGYIVGHQGFTNKPL
jgi:hypothetical protein